MNIYDVYQVCEKKISDNVTEISVDHLDWNDLQLEIEARHLLVSPKGTFFITDQGLHPVKDDEALWYCIPKLTNLEDEDGNPYFSDFRAAEKVIEHIKSCILETCPNWGKVIPGRRQSRRRS